MLTWRRLALRGSRVGVRVPDIARGDEQPRRRRHRDPVVGLRVRAAVEAVDRRAAGRPRGTAASRGHADHLRARRRAVGRPVRVARSRGAVAAEQIRGGGVTTGRELVFDDRVGGVQRTVCVLSSNGVVHAQLRSAAVRACERDHRGDEDDQDHRDPERHDECDPFLLDGGDESLRDRHRADRWHPVFGGSGAPTGMFLITGSGLNVALLKLASNLPMAHRPLDRDAVLHERHRRRGCVQSEPWKVWLLFENWMAVALARLQRDEGEHRVVAARSLPAFAAVLQGLVAQNGRAVAVERDRAGDLDHTGARIRARLRDREVAVEEDVAVDRQRLRRVVPAQLTGARAALRDAGVARARQRARTTRSCRSGSCRCRTFVAARPPAAQRVLRARVEVAVVVRDVAASSPAPPAG